MAGIRKRQDQQARQAYELARFNAFLSMQVHLSPESKQLLDMPDKIWHFSWEPKPEATGPTEAEKHHLRALIYGRSKAEEVTRLKLAEAEERQKHRKANPVLTPDQHFEKFITQSS